MGRSCNVGTLWLDRMVYRYAEYTYAYACRSIAEYSQYPCLSLLRLRAWLGVSGVATGTLLAQWVGFLVSLYAAYRQMTTIGVDERVCLQGSVRRVLAMKGKWGEFFRVNKDIFLRTLCLVAVNFFFTSSGGKQGPMILAVNTLLMTLFTLFSYIMDGFAYAERH